MTRPTPGDPARALDWRNYVITQATQASLGLIPRNAVALGVRIAGDVITMHCQLLAVADDDKDDLDEIVGELWTFMDEDDVRVGCACEVVSEPRLSPDDGIYWIYAARYEWTDSADGMSPQEAPG